MKLTRPAIALASLLAAAGLAGCAGNKPKSTVVEAPKYKSLPTKTAAEASADLGSIVYSTPDQRIIRYNLAQSSTVSQGSSTTLKDSDLTADLRKKYGNVVQNPLSVSGIKGVFFVNNGNLYYANGNNVSLLGEKLKIDEYQVVGTDDNFDVFFTSHTDGNSIKKLTYNGSLENIIKLSDSNLGEVEVSPDKTRLICAQTSNKGKEYLLINLGNKYSIPTPLSFKKTVGTYEENEGPGNVSWTDATGILFTYRFSGYKGNNLFSARLNGHRILDDALNPIRQLTYDDANITFAKQSGTDIIYVSDKSGSPALYKLKDGVSVKLANSFNGRNPYSQ